MNAGRLGLLAIEDSSVFTDTIRHLLTWTTEIELLGAATSAEAAAKAAGAERFIHKSDIPAAFDSLALLAKRWSRQYGTPPNMRAA